MSNSEVSCLAFTIAIDTHFKVRLICLKFDLNILHSSLNGGASIVWIFFLLRFYDVGCFIGVDQSYGFLMQFIRYSDGFQKQWRGGVKCFISAKHFLRMIAVPEIFKAPTAHRSP